MESIFEVCNWSNPEEVKFKLEMRAEMERIQFERDIAEESARMLGLVRFVQENIEDITQRKNCTATLEVLASRLQELAR